MSCEALRRSITAFVDGELMDEDRAALEAHVARCAECRHALEEEQAVVAALRGAPRLHQPPETLRQDIEAMLDRAAPEPAAARRRFAWPAWLAAGVVLGVLGSLAASRAVRSTERGPASDFSALAVDTHLRYARGQLPLEVVSERPDAVSGWFSGRVPFHLELPDYRVGPGERKFYQLEGGRLVSFRGDYAAYAVYRMDREPVSLLVTSSERVQPSGGEVVRSGSLVFHLERVAGLNVITWSDKGLTYALASDVAVSGARSCMVCHGSPEERRRIQEFPAGPRS